MKYVNNKKLLVTTGLLETFGKDKEILFLGGWCRPYKNNDLIQARKYTTILYHWSDTNKRRHDYDYLGELFERVLVGLVSSLNKFHNTNYSLRYWRIILGPWLFTYVSVLWDRWENIRVAFDKEEFDSTVVMILDAEKLVPINFDDWNRLVIDDLWNHHIFTGIIKFLYKEKVNIDYVPYTGSYQSKNNNIAKRSNIQKLIGVIDKLFGKIQKNYKVVFVHTYFKLPVLARLSIRLRQFPRIHSSFSKSIDVSDYLINRHFLFFKMESKNLFEKYLESNIVSQIPIAYVEGYSKYRNEIEKIDCDGEVIFTANAHLRNDIFNAWCAKKVEEGKKLIISQHGGGIKSEMAMIRHQEKIADKMVVWHKPQENIHVQLSPNKLINIQKKRLFRSDLTLLGYEPKIYTNRAQSGPIGDGVYDDYMQKIDFCNYLSTEVKKHIRVRSSSYGDGWFNSLNRYKDDLGEDKISSYKTLKKAIQHSRIIVCTYPQTTFSEAMNSGVPTILIIDINLWQIDKNFGEVLNQLKDIKIIFYDPKEAAEHVNNIWSNPSLWWEKPETIQAREYFFDMCGRVSDDWLDEWAAFFKENI